MITARCAAIVLATAVVAAVADFDHTYAAYDRVLRSAVLPPRVNYAALTRDRAALDAAVATVNGAGTVEERLWSRAERIAFWINAYNLFTLRAIVDHYPIRSQWFTLQPRNSIRQIDGVWTTKGKSGTKLVMARSTDGGKTFSTATTIPESDAAGNRGWHNLLAAADGRLFVIWLDHREMADHTMGAAPQHAHGCRGPRKT